MNNAVRSIFVVLSVLFGTFESVAQPSRIRCSYPAEPRVLKTPDSIISNINVKQAGAKGDGLTDDAEWFQKAVDDTPAGGEVFVPPGNYVIGKTIIIDKPVSLTGTGVGSQLFATDPGATLILLNQVQGVTIRGLFLASAGNISGTDECSRLIHMFDSHRNRIDNVILWGGRTGIHLNGSILNTLIDVTTGSNLRKWGSNDSYFFKPESEIGKSEFWIYSDRQFMNGHTSQANTLIGPRLEGGRNGIYLVDEKDYDHGNGINIFGGAIEGVSESALYFHRTEKPVNITGLHLEANANDLQTFEAANIRLTSVFSIPNNGVCAKSSICGIVIANNTRNVQITDSAVDRLLVSDDSKRIVLQNITYGSLGPQAEWDFCSDNSLKLPDRMTTSNSFGPLDLISSYNIGNNCGRQ